MSIPDLYDRYRRRKEDAVPIYKLEHIRQTGERTLTEDEEKLLKYSRRIPLRMIGVWDTVGALGIPWTGMPFIGRRNFYFHNPNLSKIYEHSFQALAIDENRAAYVPTLWTLFVEDPKGNLPVVPPQKPPADRVEQRWFIGAHADVGGGYKDDPLSRIPLAWLQGKADKVGLKFTTTVSLRGSEHLTAPVDSYAKFLGGVYRVLKFGKRFYRPIGVERRKVKTGWSFPVNEVIDASVFRRVQAADYRPKNLAEWGRRKGVNLSTLTGDQVA